MSKSPEECGQDLAIAALGETAVISELPHLCLWLPFQKPRNPKGGFSTVLSFQGGNSLTVVLRMLHFHCRHRFNPGRGTKILHTVWPRRSFQDGQQIAVCHLTGNQPSELQLTHQHFPHWALPTEFRVQLQVADVLAKAARTRFRHHSNPEGRERVTTGTLELRMEFSTTWLNFHTERDGPFLYLLGPSPPFHPAAWVKGLRQAASNSQGDHTGWVDGGSSEAPRTPNPLKVKADRGRMKPSRGRGARLCVPEFPLSSKQPRRTVPSDTRDS